MKRKKSHRENLSRTVSEKLCDVRHERFSFSHRYALFLIETKKYFFYYYTLFDIMKGIS